jgi:hypothetical protein
LTLYWKLASHPGSCYQTQSKGRQTSLDFAAN